MHLASTIRMQWIYDNYIAPYAAKQEKVKVLDIGSYDVNGSYRKFFDEKVFHYTGLDMEAGPNVDIVPENIYNWKELESNSFDIVISGQVLEHVEFFWQTAAEMTRVLRKGGLLCLIVPRGFELHRCPIDCYRFDTDGVIAIARYCNLTPLHASTNLQPIDSGHEWFVPGLEDTMLVAKKPYNWKGLLDFTTYKLEQIDLQQLTSGLVPPEDTYFGQEIIRKHHARLNQNNE